MDSELLVEFWETVKEYIPAKDKQTAADHIIINLVDIGIGDEELKELRGLDTFMEHATEEHLEEEFEEELEWDE